MCCHMAHNDASKAAEACGRAARRYLYVNMQRMSSETSSISKTLFLIVESFHEK